MRRRTIASIAGAAVLATVVALGPTSAEAGPADPPTAFTPQLVRVATPTAADRFTLAELALDRSEHVRSTGADVVLHSAADLAALRGSGLDHRVLIPDLITREADNNAANAAYAASTSRSPLPSGRTAYRTLEDYESEMAGLAAQHPKLVRELTLRHPSLDGRTVHGLEIGSDVSRAATGRPTFLMVGLHHAREWPSAEHTMEFAHDLVAGYGTGRRITRLLDAARVVVVPVVNVDGFDLSRTAGGLLDLNILNPLDPSATVLPTLTMALTPGMAYMRKNCRIVDGLDTPDGSCAATLTTPAAFGTGVDLNRNYGMWWGGPGAADPAPSATEFHAGLLDPRYHGAAAFSEPETQNIRDLVLSRSVTGLITNHTSGNLVLRPWSAAPDHVTAAGRTVGLAPDETALRELGARFAAQNGYANQRSHQLYDGVGTTEDWAYAATGTFGYTFEIGPTEFHPPFEDVVDQYVGAGEFAGRGNRAAYLIALEAAVDSTMHGVLAGRAPAGARLTITRTANTPTWDGVSDAVFTASIRVPRTGRFTWHVNPSTRPVADAPERYTLTCTVGGDTRLTRQVAVGRGTTKRLDLRGCVS